MVVIFKLVVVQDKLRFMMLRDRTNLRKLIEIVLTLFFLGFQV